MGDRFSIRPKPQIGESFSGYLMRISERNCTKFGSLRQYLGINEDYAHYLDILPGRIVNISNLVNLLGIDEESISKMTFLKLYYKFYPNIIAESDNFRHIIGAEIVKDKRRYCVSCLRESGYYRLLWQIREIDMCNIHFTKLQSRCSLCGAEQPIVSNTLGKFLCFKCGNDISKQEELMLNDESYISMQLNVIDDWLFLLNEEFSLGNYSCEPLNKEVFLVVLSLYVSQMMESTFDRKKISFFDTSEITDYLRFVNNLNNGKCITLSKILKLSRNFKINLSRLLDLDIPKTYVDSIKDYRSKYEKITLGVCLAPWCNSYKSDKSLVTINSYKYNRRHYLKCVCEECFNKYGYNVETGDWENIDGFINLLWKKVLPGLKSGSSLCSLISMHKVYWDRLSNAIGYAANYGLLNEELFEKYGVKDIPNNIISYFTYLCGLNCSMRKNAKKCFKWNSHEFYYYLNIKEVQHYLLFEKDIFMVKCSNYSWRKNNIKEELEELLKYYIEIDKDINLKNIKIDLNCSNNIVYRNKLEDNIRIAMKKQTEKRKVLKKKYIVNKMKEYFQKKILTDYLLTCDQVYKDLGFSNGGSGLEKKEIRSLVASKVKEYNIKVKRNRTKKLDEQLDKIIKQFSELGEKSTYKKIAFQLGISESMLKRNTELKKAINCTIKKYYY